MPPADLTDEELDALVKLITNELKSTRFPLSPRSRVLRSARDKFRAALGEDPAEPDKPKRRRR
jgi:hypothetical protein